jgi:hypothetical protein
VSPPRLKCSAHPRLTIWTTTLLFSLADRPVLVAETLRSSSSTRST